MTCFALGKFDALHRGHRALVNAAASHDVPGLLYFTGMAAVLGWDQRTLPQMLPGPRYHSLECRAGKDCRSAGAVCGGS